MQNNKWARLLAYVTGLVNQQLLLQNEYLAAEKRILRSHLPARLRLSDPERSTLAEIGKRLGRLAFACKGGQEYADGRSGIEKGNSGSFATPLRRHATSISGGLACPSGRDVIS